MSIPRFLVGIVSVGIVVVAAGGVSGQDYPNRPIRIVTSAAGGGSDYTSRLIAQGISGPLGQSVIVDNRPALLSAETVSKSPPDGYSVLVTGSTFWIGPLLQKVPYDVANDFSPISLISREVNVVAVHPSLPVKSIKELIALAKAKPGQLNYSHSGVGGPRHLGGELFKSMAGVSIALIPYKGGGPALTALISGEVQLTITDVRSVTPYVKSGKLRALAVTSAEPSPLVPGLPTVAASGVAGYESVSMTGMFAPAGTPVAAIRRLNQEIARVLGRADIKEKFFNTGAEAVGSSPEDFAATVKSEMTRLGKVINDAGIRVE